MPVIYVNFRYGLILPRPDGKTCRNCAYCDDNLKPKAVCLACTRFGHDKGTQDNWQPVE